MSLFADRREAGRRLAERLAPLAGESPVVLALPRGGVEVAYEVAAALRAPLDIVVARKLGAPGDPELAIGAVVEGDHPEAVLNAELVSALGVTQSYLHSEVDRQLQEIARRQRAYRGGRAAVPLEGRTVILVDDGVATGASIGAALRGIRRARPRKVVVAVPVAPREALAALSKQADEAVCLELPAPFVSVGAHYADFAQTSDERVVELLASAWGEK